ncbi:MAG TPA: hypothetical protein VHB97_04645 [Polyangia bacterium]|jgi:hypothetical protein|nr:hypothetical protein [Polyangia bacterium]
MRTLLATALTLLVAAPALADEPAIADADGHPFALTASRGRPVALIVVSRYTRKDAERINDALTPLAGNVEVITAVDFMGIPGLFHGYARRKIHEAQQRSPIRMLVDEHGQWRRFFGVAPDKRVDILVIDRAGTLRGRFAGPKEVHAALDLIRTL